MKSSRKAKSRPGRRGEKRPVGGRDRMFVLAVAAACLVVGVVYGALSEGTYQDDDVDRYYMARQVWDDPTLLLDRWGMPLSLLLLAIPAKLFGYAGVEAMTAVITAGAAAFTGMAALAAGMAAPWAAVILVFFQPLVLALAYSGLAEPAAAMVLAAVLWAWYAGRGGRAVWLAGLLPLARIEMGVLTLVVLAAAWPRIGWRERAGALAPVAAWNLAGLVLTGEPLYILALGGERPMASLGPGQYPLNLIVAAGPIALFFFLWALISRLQPAPAGPSPAGSPPAGSGAPSPPGGGTEGAGGRFPALAAVLFAAHFLVLTLLAWEALPLGRSTGFLRHLAGAAPALALVAHWGLLDWCSPVPRPRALRAAFAVVWPAVTALFLSHVLIAHAVVGDGRVERRWIATALLGGLGLVWLWRHAPRSRTAAAALAAAMAVGFALLAVRPVGLDPERQAIRVAVEQLEKLGLADAVVYTNHPWYAFLTGRDRYDETRTPKLRREGLKTLPLGSVVMWENHYGPRLWGDVPDTLLRNDPRLERLLELDAGTERNFHVLLFLRVR